MTSISTQNKADLEKLYKDQGYKDISFFISPNTETSIDECVNEVLPALRAYADGKLQEAHGKLK